MDHYAHCAAMIEHELPTRPSMAGRRDDPPRLGRALLGHAGVLYTFTVGLGLGRQRMYRVARLEKLLETKRPPGLGRWPAFMVDFVVRRPGAWGSSNHETNRWA